MKIIQVSTESKQDRRRRSRRLNDLKTPRVIRRHGFIRVTTESRLEERNRLKKNKKRR